jgi:hypothetical protein
MTKLEEITDADLHAELKRRSELEAQRIAAKEAAYEAAFLRLIKNPEVREFIDLCLPEHARTTCTDENLNVGRCQRCTASAAIAKAAVESWLDLDQKFHFELRIGTCMGFSNTRKTLSGCGHL